MFGDEDSAVPYEQRQMIAKMLPKVEGFPEAHNDFVGIRLET